MSSETPTRPDGRKAMLVYLDPELIRLVKYEAIRQDTHAYVLVEQAIRENLQKGSKESS